MTGSDLVAASLRLLGVLASGESAESQEAVDGLSAVNRMLDSWSTQNLLIYNKARETFALVANTSTYTMGTAGTASTTRALKVENALLRFTDTNPVIEKPISIVTKDEYAAIVSKGTTSTVPQVMYPDGAYPVETLTLWPVPTTTYQVAIYSWKPLTQIAALSTTLSLPPGYERALVYNAAMEIAPEYGRAPSQLIMSAAAESLANIKRMNSKPHFLRVDSALQAVPSRFNIYTGEIR